MSSSIMIISDYVYTIMIRVGASLKAPPEEDIASVKCSSSQKVYGSTAKYKIGSQLLPSEQGSRHLIYEANISQIIILSLKHGADCVSRRHIFLTSHMQLFRIHYPPHSKTH